MPCIKLSFGIQDKVFLILKETFYTLACSVGSSILFSAYEEANAFGNKNFIAISSGLVQNTQVAIFCYVIALTQTKASNNFLPIIS